MRPGRRFLLFFLVLLCLAACAWIERSRVLDLLRRVKVAEGRTVAQVQEVHGEESRASYEASCRAAGIPWPPHRVMVLAFKEERVLEVWGAGEQGPYAFLKEHAILAASGGPGPKRREGDLQVPEGIYGLPALNPNSRFHLSIRVGYPNEEDIRNSRLPRPQMGGDIFIHGGSASIGCIAIGDGPIEELFCLAASVPASRRRVLIAPCDLRARPDFDMPEEEPWVRALHARLARELAGFRR